MSDTKLMSLEARPEREDYLACEEAPADNVTVLVTKAQREAARNSGKKLNDWIGGILQRAVEETPAEAMRLVPDRVLTETLYWMARAYERVHSMPRVSDTELASKIEAAKADLGRARDASPVLSNSAAHTPEGGAVDDRLHNAISKLKDWVSLIQLRKNGGCVSGNPIVDCVNDLPVIIRELETAELEIEGAFEALEDAALATREEAPAEAGEIDLYDDKVQAGIAWTMRQWGETLGLKTWTMGDGSESVEGDVGAEIHTILVDAGLRDPETNEMAALRAQPQAREEAQPVAWRCSREWPSDGLGKWQYHDGPPNPSHLARNVQALFLQPTPDPQPVGWLRAVDEEMVCAHLGVAEAEDSYETAKKKLASLIQWNIAVAMDPSIGGHLASDELRAANSARSSCRCQT